MNILKKNVCLSFCFLFLLVLTGCFSSKNTSTNSTNNATTKPLELPQKQEMKDFIDNYSGYNLVLYTQEKRKNLYQNILNSKIKYTQMSKNDVFNLLQTPTLNKIENNFEIWQYKSSKCTIVFLWNINNNQMVNVAAYDNALDFVNYKQCLVVSFTEFNN